tara:strand:- start:1922 stop:2212 length:291 start_codon:yes stop_codon:yes gene_type:complete
MGRSSEIGALVGISFAALSNFWDPNLTWPAKTNALAWLLLSQRPWRTRTSSTRAFSNFSMIQELKEFPESMQAMFDLRSICARKIKKNKKNLTMVG